MFRSDYEMELENIVSEALSLIEGGDTKGCQTLLKESNDKINEAYDEEFVG